MESNGTDMQEKEWQKEQEEKRKRRERGEGGLVYVRMNSRLG